MIKEDIIAFLKKRGVKKYDDLILFYSTSTIEKIKGGLTTVEDALGEYIEGKKSGTFSMICKEW